MSLYFLVPALTSFNFLNIVLSVMLRRILYAMHALRQQSEFRRHG